VLDAGLARLVDRVPRLSHRYIVKTLFLGTLRRITQTYRRASSDRF
jgi:hypothetical protein